MNTKSNNVGSLMAVDALNRKTVDTSSAPAPRNDRYVGLFYFLWLGETGKHKPLNVSEIVAKDPDAGYKPDSDVWGGIGTYHHWGEPFYGYYHSDDEWVVRRHMKLLILAGIDFLFFDTTNAVTYDHNAKLVMRVLDEYYQDGWKIPRVMFYTNTHSGKTAQHIYETYYKANYCPNTWFYYEGKPVIIAKEDECSDEVRAFFNVKRSQWPNEPDKIGGWPWMDFTRPQRVFLNDAGKPETISVSVAQHPQLRFGDSVLYGEKNNCGRGFRNGENDPDPDAYKHGYNFAEQFERAIEADPPIVLVTGWNEWIAGRWQGIPERPIMFVDCANYEYSRDIEMMRGGYFDNFYMQLVNYVRRYKGIPSDITSNDAEQIYYNFRDGDFSREAEGYGQTYVNKTQRNAITSVAVSCDGKKLCFKITAKDEIVLNQAGSWMKIYVNTLEGAGYNYIVNHTPKDQGSTTVARVTEGLSGIDTAPAEYCIQKNEMTVSVLLSDLELEDSFTIWFKVADSNEMITSVEDFYDKGDVAPLGRLNYVFKYNN